MSHGSDEWEFKTCPFIPRLTESHEAARAGDFAEALNALSLAAQYADEESEQQACRRWGDLLRDLSAKAAEGVPVEQLIERVKAFEAPKSPPGRLSIDDLNDAPGRHELLSVTLDGEVLWESPRRAEVIAEFNRARAEEGRPLLDENGHEPQTEEKKP